jgi:hypothetical protein
VRTFAGLALIAIVGWASVARADDRVAVIAPPAGVEDAIRAQLAPWAIAVVVAPAPAPVDDDAARALAAALEVQALVWFADDSVAILDVRHGDVVRRARGAVIDEATAAAIALTVKTVVRGPTVAPPPPPPPPPLTLPMRVRPPAWRATIVGTLRWHVEGLEPRLALAFARRLGPVAVVARGSLGTGVTARTLDFAGTWRDRTFGAAIAVPRAVGAVEITAAAGASLHLTGIRGVVFPRGAAAASAAAQLGLDAELGATWRRGPLAIGAQLGATWLPWRRRYTVAGQPVFTVGHGEVEAGLSVGFGF